MPDKSPTVARRIARFILMAMGLGVTGIVFGLIGALIGGKVIGGNSVGFGALGLALASIIIGYPAGIIVGIVLIKKILHQRGSLLLGISGSIIGAVIVIALAEPLNLNSNTGLLFGTFLLCVPIFCLSGFLLRK
ncbi:MAG: hypothetical protein J7L19_03665 [Dehalococcoidia bacterium]|nr:hypothetical protein [Dehalococcoidia bacterium]